LNVLLLRLGPLMLRSHIERHLPEPFNSPTQLERWDDSVTTMIRQGQLEPHLHVKSGDEADNAAASD
jgi:TetR/AcrR family transcriptional regulator, regulator of cefoperazone and chloramphenicol sensitivity